VVEAFADALAPAFWYLVPLVAFGFVLTLFLREVPLSEVAGMVARGEAVSEVPAAHHSPGSDLAAQRRVPTGADAPPEPVGVTAGDGGSAADPDQHAGSLPR
ncbi:MAG TPA: MFS transporter, partial [Actinotalea sp.]|nr:MFS transporter [Actinotalea sp.]